MLTAPASRYYYKTSVIKDSSGQWDAEPPAGRGADPPLPTRQDRSINSPPAVV